MDPNVTSAHEKQGPGGSKGSSGGGRQGGAGSGGAPFEPRPRGRGLAIGLYVLLATSAALALWAQSTPAGLSPTLTRITPWVFAGFAILFAGYRFRLLRAGRYPVFKAFFQVGLAVAFFALLLTAQGVRRRSATPELELMMTHRTPFYRAVAVEMARHREDGLRYGAALVRALSDRDPRVRREAHRSLVELTGQDLGPPEDEAARRAWRERIDE